MSDSNSASVTNSGPSSPISPTAPTSPTSSATSPPHPAGAEPRSGTPLQPPEPADESVLESIGKAISAPVRDAAENEERKQVGQPGKGA